MFLHLQQIEEKFEILCYNSFRIEIDNCQQVIYCKANIINLMTLPPICFLRESAPLLQV
jgi:hypothetical protein